MYPAKLVINWNISVRKHVFWIISFLSVDFYSFKQYGRWGQLSQSFLVDHTLTTVGLFSVGSIKSVYCVCVWCSMCVLVTEEKKGENWNRFNVIYACAQEEQTRQNRSYYWQRFLQAIVDLAWHNRHWCLATHIYLK